jgi:hypothetical protein
MDLSTFRARLTETIAWCLSWTPSGVHSPFLRTPELRPPNLANVPNEWGDFEYNWPDTRETERAVESVAERRANLFRAMGNLPDAISGPLAGGRILIFEPSASDYCRVSGPESRWFFDAFDVPPWDTWLHWKCESIQPLEEEVNRTRLELRHFYDRHQNPATVVWEPQREVSYLLSWVPPGLIDLAQAGIEINPAGCISWASEYRHNHYNTPFLRALDGEGFL